MKYKGHEIEKNEFGYYEAHSLKDCDAPMIFDKSLEGLKTFLDDFQEEAFDTERG